MDPNANLAEQERLLDSQERHDRRRLSELRHALEDWLAGGGFAPDWNKYPDASKAFKKWRRNCAKYIDLAR